MRVNNFSVTCNFRNFSHLQRSISNCISSSYLKPILLRRNNKIIIQNVVLIYQYIIFICDSVNVR